MKAMILGVLAGMTLAVCLSACSTTPKTADDRAELQTKAEHTLAQFRNSDPSIAEHMKSAYGMAVFPTVGKGGAVVGGAGGRGIVYEKGRPIGYTTMSQGTVGLQLGAQTYSQLILFESADDLHRFTKEEWTMSAQATAVAASSGVGKAAKYHEGVLVYVLNQEGLMGEASVGGQKFEYAEM